MNEPSTPSPAPIRIEDFPTAELPDQVAMLVAGADALAREGRRGEAETVYRRVLEAAPHHLQALTYIAMSAFETGRYEESVRYLIEAIRLEPTRPTLHQNLALVRLAQGLPGKALESIDQAIALNPEGAISHLHRGHILESLGQETPALESYGRGLARDPTLRIAPQSLPPGIRILAQRAIARLAPIRLARIDQAAQAVEAEHGIPLPARARRFLDIFKGLIPPPAEHPLQKPEFLFYPELGARPWFERGEFPWIHTFESKTGEIRREFEALEGGLEEAYVPKSTGQTIWSQLAGSREWGSFHLYRSGTPIAQILHLCPNSFAALKVLPLARGRNHAPEIFFSVLKPGVELPPHHGLSNAKLTLHLGLVVPPETAIRVGGEVRQWKEGRALIFDDSFEHSAWNHDTRPRAVLIADIWNPALSPPEQDLVERVIDAHSRFYEEYFS
jgi:aspartate beta-hydroxylase